MSTLNRRDLLQGGALLGVAGGAALAGRRLGSAPAAAAGHANTGHGIARGHAGGVSGPTFRQGARVDHRANGFNPTELLRDFEYGKTRRLASGRVLREWEVFSTDKEIEVAPGVKFPAWTFNGRIPGPTLRCREGERLRLRFVNGS
ncbi:MAG: multicopper oxidase domain-containing protein, partial [Actinobacteria bacterium]|nr:multicopper oxidase domain-containing protein [Actinomycetota bacterium]